MALILTACGLKATAVTLNKEILPGNEEEQSVDINKRTELPFASSQKQSAAEK